MLFRSDDRLAEMPPGTKVLNDWELGHYTMARHPQVQLVMHGYVDMFTEGELDRNLRIVRVQPKWDTSVEALDADYGFVDPDSAMGYALVHQLGWTEVDAEQHEGCPCDIQQLDRDEEHPKGDGRVTPLGGKTDAVVPDEHREGPSR